MINSTLKLKQIQEFTADNVNSNNQGVIGTAIAGQTTNIDLKLTDDNFITGGVLRTLGSTFGDYATFQVVDVDNVLGFGSNVVLGQYVNKWYMRSDVQEQLDENTPYPAKILANLYLRIVYVSIGTSDVQVSANYRLHKVMR